MANPALGKLLPKLLPGFLPLVIYVVAEGLWGETVGLIAGIGCGVVEFGLIMIRERKADWLTLTDTVLLAAMGGISLALQDDIFFRVKPAVIESLLAVLVGISAFGPRNFIMGKTMATLKSEGLDLSPAEQNIKAMMKGLFALLLVHIGLTLLAAFWWSKEVWLFVSGGLLYILMGIWFAGMVGRMFMQRRQLQRRMAQHRQRNV